jgi:hypothetical protein
MKLEEYKRKKGLLPKEYLGTIFTFKSKRDFVEVIKEHTIIEKTIGSRRIEPKPEVVGYRYRLNESPYSVEIWEDKIYSSNPGYASGWGDLWTGTQFASLDKNVLEQVREEEIKRVQEKYPEHWLEIIRDKKLNQLGI